MTDPIARKTSNLSNYYIKKGNVINNLTSNDTDKPLSAKQGKELKALIDSLDPEGEGPDLTDYIQKSNTSGLVKNDGTVDTNTYLKPGDITVPTKTSDLTNDGDGTNIFLVSSDLTNYVQTSNTSGLMKNDGTIDTNTYLQANDAFSGSYNDLTNKPSIPSKTSDLTNDSNFLSSVEISDVIGLSDALSSTLSYQLIQGSVSEMQQAASDLNYSEDPNGEQGDIFEWYLNEVKDIETEENVIYLLENNDGFFNEYLKVYNGEDYRFELLGSTKMDISGKEDRSNRVSTWSNLVSSNYPSATLVKNSLDDKVDKETGKGLFSGSYNDLTNKPTIPDVSGKIDTAGTGLSKTGTRLNHSNSITPQTSAVFKKFTYDGEGHITGITDVEESDLPNHSHDYISNTMSVNSNGVIWASPDLNNDGNADILSSNKCFATFYKQGKFVILYLHLVGKNPHTTTNYLPYINQIPSAYVPRDSFYHSMPNLHRDTSVTLYFHQSGSAWVVDARIAKVDSDATQNTVNCYGMIPYPIN